MITLGGLALAFSLIRLFVFKMPESPTLSNGRDAEAVEAVNYVARRNGKQPEPLHISILQDIDRELGLMINPDESRTGLSRMEIIKENMKDFKSVNYKSLFAPRILARHTALIWFTWLVIDKVSPSLTFTELKRSYEMPVSHILSISTSCPPTFPISSLNPCHYISHTATTGWNRPLGSWVPSPPASPLTPFRPALDDGPVRHHHRSLSLCLYRCTHNHRKPRIFLRHGAAREL